MKDRQRISDQLNAHAESLEQPLPSPIQAQQTLPAEHAPDYAAIVVQHTTELIALIDGNGLFRFVTPAFARLGYTAADLIGKPCADFLYPDDAPSAPGVGPASLTETTVRFRNSDGSWNWIAFRTQPIVHRGETFSLAVGSVRSAQNAPEEHLIQAQRASVVSALAAGMIYDLNNMLTIIAGSAEIVAEALPHGHAAQGDLATISAVTAHAGSLTNQVLQYVHDQQHERQTIRMDLLLHDARALIERLTGPLITLTIDAPADLWPIVGVPSELMQAVLTLVATARQSVPAGGAIVIRARNMPQVETPNHGPAITVDISAAGSDMTAVVRPKRSVPPGAREPDREQTNLSLVGCRQIIEAHGGMLQRAETIGSIPMLRIMLPRAEHPASPARTAQR